jgi:hypothetical protein
MRTKSRFDVPEARFAVLAAALTASAGACKDPSYVLPDGAPPPPSVRLVQSAAGTTVDLGNDATDLCVLQSVTAWVPGAGAASNAGDDGSAGESDAGDSQAQSQVNLYFDSPTGTWHLASNGSASATVACAPWTAFGGVHDLWRVDNGGANLAAAYPGAIPTVTVVADGGQTCVLSDLQGDFSTPGNSASIDDAGSLTVGNASGNDIYASETCFAGAPAVPYADFQVNALDGSVSVPVVPDGDGLCGLSAVASLGQAPSGVLVARGRALGTYSSSTVRCFLFELPDAQ